MPSIPDASTEALVTVIIPVWNSERYLRQCLDTVLAQSHARLELIAVDDGSHDASPVILQEYARRDTRVRVLTEQNQGQGVARNHGLGAARGQWICFVDHDDYVHPRYIERLLEEAERQDADLVLGTAVLFDDKSGQCVDDPTYSSLWFPVAVDASGFAPGSHERKEDLLRVNLAPWAKLFRSDLACRLQFACTRRFEDIPFVYAAVTKARRVAVVREQLYYHRRRDDSVQDRINKGRDPAGAVEDFIVIHRLCLDLFAQDSVLAEMYKCRSIDLLWQSYGMLPARSRRIYREKLRRAFGEDMVRTLDGRRRRGVFRMMANFAPHGAVRLGLHLRASRRDERRAE